MKCTFIVQNNDYCQKQPPEVFCEKKVKNFSDFTGKKPLIRTRICAYQGVRNVHFFRKNWRALFSWNTCFFRSTLLPFFKEIFLMRYSIHWKNVLVWWPLLLETLCNMCNVIISVLICDVRNFEINLVFLNQVVCVHSRNKSGL